MQKMAMPSLSYDPATDRDMYPGTIEIIAAATKPAPTSCKYKFLIKYKFYDSDYVNISLNKLSTICSIKITWSVVLGHSGPNLIKI